MKDKLLKFLDFYPRLVISGFTLAFLFLPEFNKFDRASNIWFLILFALFVLDAFSVQLLRRFLKDKMHLDDSSSIYQKIFLGGFLFFYFISFLKSQTFNFGYTEVLMTFCGALIFLNFDKSRIVNRQSRFLSGLAIFVLILNAVFGYYMYIVSHHNRAFGFFYDPAIKAAAWPNAFALFILMLWPVFVYLCGQWSVVSGQFLKRQIPLAPFIKAGLAALILSTFILTFSRAAYIAFFGQIFLFLIYGIYSIYRRDRLRSVSTYIYPIIFVVILTFGLVYLAQNLRSNYQNNVNTFTEKINFENGEKQTSIKERADFMKGAIILTKDEPLFGYGPMSFGYVYRSVQQDWLSISDHPHNMFLKIMVENGIPAMIFFILFIFSVLLKAFRKFLDSDGSEKFLILVLIISILGAIAHNLVDYNFNFALNLIIFWVILGILNSLSVENPEKTINRFSPISIIILLCTIYLVGFESYSIYNSIQAGRSQGNGNDISAELYAKEYRDSTFYPRYIFFSEAAKYIGKGDLGNAELMYLKYIEQNKWDSTAYNRLGEFYRDKLDDREKALFFFKTAIEYDSKNFWIYYLNYLNEIIALDRSNEMDDFVTKINTEIADYMPKLKNNLHYTAKTGNPNDLIKILSILQNYNTQEKDFYRQKISEIETYINKY